MNFDGKLGSVLLACLLTAAAACATVASLDVTRDPGPPPADLDEAGVVEGGVVEDGGRPPTDAADESQLVPEPPKVCGCPIEQGCCVPSAGAGACTPPAGAGACASGGGVFLRCVGGDVGNGRACCLAADSRSTFYAASCDQDAGAQVCATVAECPQGSCQEIPCRGVSPALKVCVTAGATAPSCPP